MVGKGQGICRLAGGDELYLDTGTYVEDSILGFLVWVIVQFCEHYLRFYYISLEICKFK